ncbi:MAG: response regulator [candidate division Zixibacteria bacterium]|nr:response regulator [candidate division Zixibacteria bacterium]
MKVGDATIFVVDDDYSIRRSLKRLFTSAGFNVETFSSADDFLSYRRRDVPGCIILDVRMPGVDGLELQRQLAEMGSELAIIFITAYADEEVEARALAAGARVFFAKPLDDEVLLRAVREALGTGKAEEL